MKQVLTEGDIPLEGELRVELGAIITPLARDAARQRGVRILELPPAQVPRIAPAARTVALGADHGGFRMKEALKPVFAELGLEVRDLGVHQETPADYPDIAEQVALQVAQGKAARGVILDGAGIGSAIAANKVPGIRAALCYDRASARNSREHNDANVLTLGGRLLTQTQAEEVLRTWLATPFGGGRHAPRVKKIEAVEKRHSLSAAQPHACECAKTVCTGCLECSTKAAAALEPARVPTQARQIAALIDHTLLRPEATADDIRALCRQARTYGFASVCVNPYWVPLAAAELAGSPVLVCTVAGFPLGASPSSIKAAEAAAAVKAGAREVDMVINVGALRSGDHDTVRADIQAVVDVCHPAGAAVKTILETALLNDDQKRAACRLAKAAGADFVKTSTGFGPAGATVQDVSLMRAEVGPGMGVKAAGGIRTYEDLRKMVAAGASRIGASASVRILQEAAS